ncbi:unnamed protein product [Rhizoctonia solani]|uniref:Zn(2)-C6 fungal-type domain-containing protein n=1 Tax=Rhizoctonia solani TaxID=456999 RepID=A0A8H2X247_9AGAM|nr:unnamed protein product [Rhizoctonia solani]
MTARSVTGCFTCKRRRKKCDEKKPYCVRCQKGGFECEGYPTLEGRMRRVTFDSPDPSPTQSTSGTESPGAPIDSMPVVSIKGEFDLVAPPEPSEGCSDPVKTPSSSNTTPSIDWNLSIQRNSGAPHTDSFTPEKNMDQPQSLESNLLCGPETSDSSFTEQFLLLSPGSFSSLPSFITPGSTLFDLSATMIPRQANSLGSLLSHPKDQTSKLVECGRTNLSSGLLYGPAWPLTSDTDFKLDDEDDPEGIRNIICRSLTPDPNTQSNALSFVLQSYSSWVNFATFEPLKVAGIIREGVIMQFASSPEVRTRTCLIANVIEREKDMQNALRLILIQRYSCPLFSVIALMEAAAPIFRRACPEPPEKLVNLPNILTSPGLNLQHFAATDVLISITTARPMFFKYDVECNPEVFSRLVEGHYGLQWLHGAPDRFIVLLAWINALFEDHGRNVDPRYVTEIESQVQEAKIKLFSADPIVLILRFAVQECWRQTVYVYLYMTLCGSWSDDPRVTRAVRAFTNIVNGVEPGRNPDSFLFIPMMVVGAFAYRERDRNVIRQRMMGLRECTNPNAAGYDCLEVLEDIWRRTQAENRPAVWLDLRISCQKIAGI